MMREIWDIAIGVVGCFAIFGLVYGAVSLVKRLVGGMLSSRGDMSELREGGEC